MRKIASLLIVLFLIQTANAQIHEIGVFGGGSNFIGDVGPTTFVYPKQPALGIIYKWNRNPRYSWRFSAMYSKVKARDAKSDIAARRSRDYNFSNPITEFSAGLEFNFFDFNLHNTGVFGTPYLYSGLSYFTSDNLYVLNDQYNKDGRSSGMAIPIVGGYKMKITHNLVLGLEAGARYTFKDDIDGSFPEDNKYTSLKFGNTNSKDWYVFSGFTLTYTFGVKPCYCPD